MENKKTLFLNKCDKSLKNSKNALGYCFSNNNIRINFNKKNNYYFKIYDWLIQNNYHFEEHIQNNFMHPILVNDWYIIKIINPGNEDEEDDADKCTALTDLGECENIAFKSDNYKCDIHK